MKCKQWLVLVMLALFAVSCGSRKPAVSHKEEQQRESPRRPAVNRDSPAKVYTDVVDEYIDLYAGIAQEEMRLYKIPASITLAQGILESGAGRGTLSRTANNHFGIKCHEWTGEKVYHDDDASGECFRKYRDPGMSFRDHSLFLSERRRYSALFELDIDDYKGWAAGLRRAGYATDRLYPQKLISLIERYQLDRFDAEVLGYSSTKSYTDRNQTESYKVKQGDTLYSIAKRYNLTVQQLQEFNNLSGSNIAIGQELYLGPASTEY